MSKMIQVRNVSDETHRVLKVRAARAGLSLSDYIKQDLDRLAARPSIEEFDARLRGREAVDVPAEQIVAWVRDARQT